MLKVKLIFLTYVNRSGSTYLANLFSRSPEVLVCPEGEALMNELLTEPEKPFTQNKVSKRRLQNIFQNDPKLKWWNLSELDIQTIPQNVSNLDTFVHFLTLYQKRIKPGATVILFKAERLIYLFERLIRTDTEHTFYYISIIRDCRGVYASQRKTKNPDTGKWLSHNPVRTALQWNFHLEKTKDLKRLGTLEVIKYEDLIAKFDSIVPKILKMVDISILNVASNPGDLFDRLPKRHKEIHQNIVSPPLIEKCTEWEDQLPRYDRIILEQISGPLLKDMGYNVREIRANNSLRILITYYLTKYYFSKIIKKIKILLFSV